MNSKFRFGALALALSLFCSTTLKAEVKLPAFFSNGMVIQQQTNASFWGTSTPNKKLTIVTSWNKKKYTVDVDGTGKWKVALATPTAGGPYSITFNDGKQTLLQDVLVGEVWLCSGQSNMEMPMKGYKNQPVDNSNMDILKSANSQIRLFTVGHNSVIDVQNDVKGDWQAATPESVREFSATAYYYGRLLQQMLNVPVGLICSSWGGSCAEAWMDKEMLKGFPEIKIPKSPEDIVEKNRTPTTLYQGMIAPLVGYTIKGAIWYQGESNYDRSQSYTDLFSTMINQWRAKWNQGNFPFYFCQIAPYDYSIITPAGKEVINSAYLREAQSKIEWKVENTGMAVLLDAGLKEGIHPRKKQIAGERLALQALVKTYKINGVTADGPVYKEMAVQNDTVVLSFDRTQMWVAAPKGDLQNFKVAGADKKFYPAKAWIVRSKVYVKSDEVKKPVAVRYAFENYVDGDLYGTEGLPVSSFRTDNW
jgi:sialate O-acetylesterase